MRLFFTSLVTLFSFAFLYGQAPQGLSYQAVARNPTGTPIVDENILVKFEILQGSDTGTVIFTESPPAALTGPSGLFSLTIGGTNTTEFEAIDWSNGPMFLKVTINGTLSNTTQIMSVPYALYANKAPSVTADNSYVSNYNSQSFSMREVWLDIKDNDGLQNMEVTITNPGTYHVTYGLRVNSIISGEVARYRLVNIADPADTYTNFVVHPPSLGMLLKQLRILEFDSLVLPKTFKLQAIVEGDPSADSFAADDASISVVRIE
ncbi:MAG: hypothetical protein IPJ00_19545 [Saprospirales bacterium]|nr:hypothetical protein [Saprospirales bacterium]